MKMKKSIVLLAFALTPLAAGAQAIQSWKGPSLQCVSKDPAASLKLDIDFSAPPAKVLFHSEGSELLLQGNIEHSFGFFESYTFTADDGSAVVELHKQAGCGRGGCWDDFPKPWHGKLSGSLGNAGLSCE